MIEAMSYSEGLAPSQRGGSWEDRDNHETMISKTMIWNSWLIMGKDEMKRAMDLVLILLLVANVKLKLWTLSWPVWCNYRPKVQPSTNICLKHMQTLSETITWTITVLQSIYASQHRQDQICQTRSLIPVVWCDVQKSFMTLWSLQSQRKGVISIHSSLCTSSRHSERIYNFLFSGSVNKWKKLNFHHAGQARR